MANMMKRTLKLLRKSTIRSLVLVLAVQLVFSLSAFSQGRSVTGKITDAKTGEPLPGVTVIQKGTTRGTVTSNDGVYSLTNVSNGATLVFSFVGMLTQEIVYNGQSSVNVTMEMDAIGIEEVVAIGYGSIKRSDLTGSVGSVSSAELAEKGTSSVLEGLQGKVAGVDFGYSNSIRLNENN